MLVNKSPEASHSHFLWLIDMQMSWSRVSLISLYGRSHWPFPVPACVINNKAVVWQRGTVARSSSFRLCTRIDHGGIHCRRTVELWCVKHIVTVALLKWKITEVSVGQQTQEPKTCILQQRGVAGCWHEKRGLEMVHLSKALNSDHRGAAHWPTDFQVGFYSCWTK